MDIININKLSYRYDDKFIFYNFDLKIKKGSWTTIIGPNNSGKTTLVKLLCGLLKSNSEIEINNRILNEKNIKDIRSEIGVVLNKTFINETLYEELKSILENFKIVDIENRIQEISKLLKVENILYKNIDSLSGGETDKALLACALIHSPKILILDAAFDMLDNNSRKKILELLKSINKKKKITILNFTTNLEESFNSNRLIVIKEGKKLLDGNPSEVMKKDKYLYKIGIEIPFIVDLSNKLTLYTIIDKMYFDMRKMVKDIWK